MRRGKIPLRPFFPEKIKVPHFNEEVEKEAKFNNKIKI